MMAAAAGAFSPASAADPAAGPSSGRAFNGLDEASQDALEGIQANGAGQAASPTAANPPGAASPLAGPCSFSFAGFRVSRTLMASAPEVPAVS